MKRKRSLAERFPPSEPCSCDTCRDYCVRPGWWSVDEAARVIEAGYGKRMMLELSPDQTFGVLSPAFMGCEGSIAFNEFAGNGCNFLADGLCGLFGTGLQPLECRFCHHDRKGLGRTCHDALERDWNSAKGRELVDMWLRRISPMGNLLRAGRVIDINDARRRG